MSEITNELIFEILEKIRVDFRNIKKSLEEIKEI